MQLWKQALLGGYYYGSLPYRLRRNAAAAAAGRAPIIVLTYHRVADDFPNPWSIRRRDFERQMRWLKAHFELVSLDEAQQRVRAPVNDHPCVAVTFDDGYAANCEFAIPLLARWNIPCTYFVTADSVLQGKPFEHDRKCGYRCPPNTPEQVRAIAAAGIEIGGHSMTHADLGTIHDREGLRDEMVASRDLLEASLGVSISHFAFPFGQHANMSAAAFDVAREAGYKGVCSAYGGYNWPGDDAFHLQRFCVDGPLIQMKNAATVDPVKQRRIKRFAYAGMSDAPRAPEAAAR